MQEKRVYRTADFRTDEQGGEKIIEGHAAVFEQKTDISGCFYEVIERGAFDNCDLSDVALFINHDIRSLPLARTQSGTLVITVDEIGLAIRAKLDTEQNSVARAVYSSIARGDIRGMSFCFSVDAEEWQDIESEMPLRRIKRVSKIYECSACNYPAYEGTDIYARAKQILESAKGRIQDMTFEEFSRYMKRYEASADKRSQREKDLEEYERQKAAGIANNNREQPPSYVPGRGFIPAEEGHSRITEALAVEQRARAGDMLKGNKSVKMPFKLFGEQRAITITPPAGQNASIVVPTFTSEKINPDFPVVSSLVDAVSHLSLQGGDSFRQPFVRGVAVGGYTQEGKDAHDAETGFDFAQISRCKITAYAELTEEFEKLPAAAYADTVFQNIRESMRNLLAREIMVGAGIVDDQPRLVGIFSERATAIDATTDYEISQITDTTLDEILLNFGGVERAESPCVLILNKADLLAFSKVRTSTKQKFYDIQLNGNSGTISGVPFIINSACKAISAAPEKGGAAAGEYCMAYGAPDSYQLVEFSAMEVRRSDDFKFRSGVTAFKGTVFAGGNVVKHNSFLRIRKK